MVPLYLKTVPFKMKLRYYVLKIRDFNLDYLV